MAPVTSLGDENLPGKAPPLPGDKDKDDKSRGQDKPKKDKLTNDLRNQGQKSKPEGGMER
jgi:hypothetical protein